MATVCNKSGEQIRDADAKCVGNLAHVQDGNVTLTPFNTPNKGAMQATLIGKLLLGQIPFFAQLTNASSQ